MTGNERRKQNILQRRVERRAARRAAQNRPYDDFMEVFSYEHLYNTYLKQRTKLLKMKTGQRFCINAPLNLLHLHTTLMAGNYKCAKFFTRLVKHPETDHRMYRKLALHFVLHCIRDMGYHGNSIFILAVCK